MQADFLRVEIKVDYNYEFFEIRKAQMCYFKPLITTKVTHEHKRAYTKQRVVYSTFVAQRL